MTGAETTAYVDQYLAAVNYLDQTWPFNRGLAGDEVIAYAVRRALLGDPWESKENGHGYLLVPSLGTRTELNPGITDSDDLREFARGAITGRRLAFCDLCDKPILTSGGAWLPVAAPPALIVFGVCEFHRLTLSDEHRDLTWLDREGDTPR